MSSFQTSVQAWVNRVTQSLLSAKGRLCLWLLCWERNISTWKETSMF